jgi:hypothetical protein
MADEKNKPFDLNGKWSCSNWCKHIPETVVVPDCYDSYDSKMKIVLQEVNKIMQNMSSPAQEGSQQATHEPK